MTPYELTLLIHYHTTPAKFEYDETELFNQVNNQFVDDKIIVYCEGRSNNWKLTELGRAWLASILATKIPTAVYLDEHGNRLELI